MIYMARYISCTLYKESIIYFIKKRWSREKDCRILLATWHACICNAMIALAKNEKGRSLHLLSQSERPRIYNSGWY